METNELDLTSLTADIVSAYVAQIMRLPAISFLISSALSMAL